MAGEPTPALTGSDASLLDGLVELPRRRWLRLDVWIEHVDWLERWVPAFDDVSYGLPRLIAAGYAEVRGERVELRLRATPGAIALARSNRSRFMGDAVSARPWGDLASEDRTLGRLPGLDEETWDAAVRANSGAFQDAMPGPLMTGCLIAVAAIIAFFFIVWSRLRRRRS